MTKEEKVKLLELLTLYWEDIDPEFIDERKKVYDAIEVVDEDLEWMDQCDNDYLEDKYYNEVQEDEDV